MFLVRLTTVFHLKFVFLSVQSLPLILFVLAFGLEMLWYNCSPIRSISDYMILIWCPFIYSFFEHSSFVVCGCLERVNDRNNRIQIIAYASNVSRKFYTRSSPKCIFKCLWQKLERQQLPIIWKDQQENSEKMSHYQC